MEAMSQTVSTSQAIRSAVSWTTAAGAANGSSCACNGAAAVMAMTTGASKRPHRDCLIRIIVMWVLLLFFRLPGPASARRPVSRSATRLGKLPVVSD